MQTEDSAPFEEESEPTPSFKLDLRYFTDGKFCPSMARRRSKRAFELFLAIAFESLNSFGQPVQLTHEQLCDACGVPAETSTARSTISKLLRQLREEYGVIDFQPVRRKRPLIELRILGQDHGAVSVQSYVYHDERWSSFRQRVFAKLGSRAFSAEYMYMIAKYEAALALHKNGRDYWFYPLEKISRDYHVSPQFACAGLRALVQLGIMSVNYGQYGITPKENEFGRANRYYFHGFEATVRREQELKQLRKQFPNEIDQALKLAPVLINGATVKNVSGICDLLAQHGTLSVQQVFDSLKVLPVRSLKRRLPYAEALIRG
ncbi:helix-turn-helix domain-containing protein [Gimesia maris]|uniref:helix-turn-helix domain-containing protein n=1 Tax=Gimesia maris TaxID=122 RepID=UPI0030D869DD